MMKFFHFAFIKRAEAGLKNIGDKNIYESTELVNHEKRGFDINGKLKIQGDMGESNLSFEKIRAL